MTYADLEKEAEEAIEYASIHNQSINPQIAEGSGMEQFNALFDKYKTLAEDLESLPRVIKQVLGKFSENALWEVVHGELHSKPHHRRVIEGLYAFIETHKEDLRTIEEEEKEQSRENNSHDVSGNALH